MSYIMNVTCHNLKLYFNKNIIVFFLIFGIFGCKTLNTSQPKEMISVGVYNGFGAGDISVVETIEALKIDKNIFPLEISASEIMQGKLNELDVLIFPGGSGSQQLNSMGFQAAEIVKKAIIEDGKSVIGICAGSFLLSSTPDYPSLALGNVQVIDRKHYDRGRGLIAFELTEEGYKIFPELRNKPQFLQYYDGPITEPLQTENSFKELGKYVSDIHPKKDYPSGITPGKTLIYNQNIGKGKLFAIGGHPESTPGMRWMLPRMVRWVSSSELVSYPEKWVVPDYYSKEILFDSETTKLEKKLWWDLFLDEPEKQISAMDSLYDLKSRPAVRWYIGMLRDKNSQVRAHAAYLLGKTEYTAATRDLQVALETEKNVETKKVIQTTLEQF